MEPLVIHRAAPLLTSMMMSRIDVYSLIVASALINGSCKEPYTCSSAANHPLKHSLHLHH